jgi:putative (di)nucleoside polyphosphate hydrolase
MSDTKLSCGLLVLNDLGELLIGHSTGNFIWDLPKGLIDEGEDPMSCALREAREEFGLKFTPDRLTDLGRHAYYHGKDLHLFSVQTTTAETNLDNLRCTSFFEHPASRQTLLEIDGFAWANETELHRRLGKSMRRLLLDRGLFAKCKSAFGVPKVKTPDSAQPVLSVRAGQTATSSKR